MSVEENKAIARRLFEEGWAKGDLGILDQIMAADCVLHDSPTNGLDHYRQKLRDELAAFSDGQFDIQDTIAEGDKVFVRWTTTGTHTGTLDGLSPTGKQAKWQGAYCIRIANGKIAEIWHLVDTLQILLQLDVLPPWKELVEQANAKRE